MVPAPVNATEPASGGVAATSPASGLRAILEASGSTVRSDPQLWLLGALSFCVRGGVVLLLLPILWVPTPVLLSVFLAPYLTSSGLSAEAIPALAISGIVAIGLVCGAVVIAAFTDLAAYERVVASGTTRVVRGGRESQLVDRRGRTSAGIGLICLSLIGLVPILAALIPLAVRVSAVATSELEFPTQLETPFAITVLERVAPGILLLLAIVLVVDLLVTLGSRELLAARYGFRPGAASLGPLSALTLGAGRLLRLPLRTLGVWLLAWAITLVAVAAVIVALTLSWDLVREVLFSGVDDSPSGALWAISIRFVAVALFGAIWVGGVTLCGIASSLRGALWTVQSLS
jgi:hypothetical protein